jgi:hypothetical protein
LPGTHWKPKTHLSAFLSALSGLLDVALFFWLIGLIELIELIGDW